MSLVNSPWYPPILFCVLLMLSGGLACVVLAVYPDTFLLSMGVLLGSVVISFVISWWAQGQ